MRPRDPQSTSLHVHPSQPHLPPEQVTSGGRLGLAAVQWGLQTQEAAEEGDSGHLIPSEAQVHPVIHFPAGSLTSPRRPCVLARRVGG